MHLLVTRPEPDAGELKARLEALGHRATLCPLLAIDFVIGQTLRFDGARALIATSRNAIRSLARSAAIGQARSLPIFVVGPATAAEARTAGFTHVVEGPASARDLVPVIAAKTTPAEGPLVHLAGDTLAFDLKSALEREGLTVREEIVYRMQPVESLGVSVENAIRVGSLDGVILMSPRMASIFTALATSAGLADPARKLAYFCLSEAVAEGLRPLAPSDVRLAQRPNVEEVLALLAPGAPESRQSS